jgi:hypothetical protein
MITTLLTALFFIIAPSPNATAPTAVTTAVAAPVTTATPDPIPDGIRPLCTHSVEPLCI